MNEQYKFGDILDAADEIIDDLTDCKDGTVFTIKQLADDYGLSDLDDNGFNVLYHALIECAKSAGISFDFSEHEETEEGNPYDIPFAVRNIKAQIKCPHCGSIDTAKYIYGKPVYSEKLEKKLKEGKWILGGCKINTVHVYIDDVDLNPERHCNSCNKDFGIPPVIVAPDQKTGEDYRGLVSLIRFTISGYSGTTEVTITKHHYCASVKVVKIPDNGESTEERPFEKKQWYDIMYYLFGPAVYLHEWETSYRDDSILGGTEWKLDLIFEDGRECHYSGYNAYPPYWDKLEKLFSRYTDF